MATVSGRLSEGRERGIEAKVCKLSDEALEPPSSGDRNGARGSRPCWCNAPNQPYAERATYGSSTPWSSRQGYVVGRVERRYPQGRTCHQGPEAIAVPVTG